MARTEEPSSRKIISRATAKIFCKMVKTHCLLIFLGTLMQTLFTLVLTYTLQNMLTGVGML